MKKNSLIFFQTIATIVLVRYFFYTNSRTVAVFLFLILISFFLTKAYEAYGIIRLLNKNGISYKTKPVILLLGYIFAIFFFVILLIYLKQDIFRL